MTIKLTILFRTVAFISVWAGLAHPALSFASTCDDDLTELPAGLFTDDPAYSKSPFQSTELSRAIKERAAESQGNRETTRLLRDHLLLVRELSVPGESAQRAYKRMKNGAKLLSASEVQRMEALQASHSAAISRLSTAIDALKSAELPHLRKYAEDHVVDPEWAELFYDHVAALRILRLDFKNTVSLISGNVGQAPSDRLSAELIRLARELKALGYTVLYDADSGTAPLIAGVLGDAGIGISARASSAADGGVVAIRNDYMRMLSLHRGGRVVVTPESTLGVAILLHLGADVVLDTEKVWDDGLKKWADVLDGSPRGLGLTIPSADGFGSADQVIRAQYRLESGELRPLFVGSPHARQEQVASDSASLTYDELLETLETVHGILSGRLAVSGISSGTVIFGAGSYSPHFNQKVFEAARMLGSLGIPVTTGGAGGFMRVANSGAFAAGAESIGIFIGGRDQLASETRVFRDVQTRSVGVAGYPARIPLLLGDRELIIFAPGRNGTLKELAVTLLKLQANPTKRLELVFLDRQYYQGLIEQLRYLNLPDTVLHRITLLDSARELTGWINKRIAEGRLDPMKLKAEAPALERVLTSQQLDFSSREEKKGPKGRR